MLNKIKSSGFTLIELVIVIAVVAIMAAIAIPAFVDLRSTALQASAESVGGALAAAATVQKANCLANNDTTGICAQSSRFPAATDLNAILDFKQGYTVTDGLSATGVGCVTNDEDNNYQVQYQLAAATDSTPQINIVTNGSCTAS